jgi:2-phosphosulfolactate phosphatase
MNIQFEHRRQSKFFAGPSAIALAPFRVHYSSTPDAFDAKIKDLAPTNKGMMAILVVDVLRAASTLVAVAAAEATCIHIGLKPKAAGHEFPDPPPMDGPWAFGGEKDGKPIPGGEISNSPTDIVPSQFRGRSLFFLSTNGARALRSAELAEGAEIFIVCDRNIAATVESALSIGCTTFVIAAGGFYGSATLEDTVCAGRIVQCLIESGKVSHLDLDDEARIGVATAEAFVNDEHLVRVLKGAQVGRLLSEIGRGADVEAVITGKGIHPAIWDRMRSTVLRYQRRNDLGVFVPVVNGRAL